MSYNKKAIADALAKLNKTRKPKQVNDIIMDPEGQNKFPGLPTRIPSDSITMETTPYPVLGVDNFGNQQMMYPGANYTFPGAEYVDEYPIIKIGGATDWKSRIASTLNYQKGGLFYETYLKAKEAYKKMTGRDFEPPKSFKQSPQARKYYQNKYNQQPVIQSQPSETVQQSRGMSADEAEQLKIQNTPSDPRINQFSFEKDNRDPYTQKRDQYYAEQITDPTGWNKVGHYIDAATFIGGNLGNTIFGGDDWKNSLQNFEAFQLNPYNSKKDKLLNRADMVLSNVGNAFIDIGAAELGFAIPQLYKASFKKLLEIGSKANQRADVLQGVQGALDLFQGDASAIGDILLNVASYRSKMDNFDASTVYHNLKNWNKITKAEKIDTAKDIFNLFNASYQQTQRTDPMQPYSLQPYPLYQQGGLFHETYLKAKQAQQRDPKKFAEETKKLQMQKSRSQAREYYQNKYNQQPVVKSQPSETVDQSRGIPTEEIERLKIINAPTDPRINQFAFEADNRTPEQRQRDQAAAKQLTDPDWKQQVVNALQAPLFQAGNFWNYAAGGDDWKKAQEAYNLNQLNPYSQNKMSNFLSTVLSNTGNALMTGMEIADGYALARAIPGFQNQVGRYLSKPSISNTPKQLPVPAEPSNFSFINKKGNLFSPYETSPLKGKLKMSSSENVLSKQNFWNKSEIDTYIKQQQTKNKMWDDLYKEYESIDPTGKKTPDELNDLFPHLKEKFEAIKNYSSINLDEKFLTADLKKYLSKNLNQYINNTGNTRNPLNRGHLLDLVGTLNATDFLNLSLYPSSINIGNKTLKFPNQQFLINTWEKGRLNQYGGIVTPPAMLGIASQYQQGGSIQPLDYFDTELTDQEIEQYKKGGCVVVKL